MTAIDWPSILRPAKKPWNTPYREVKDGLLFECIVDDKAGIVHVLKLERVGDGKAHRAQ